MPTTRLSLPEREAPLLPRELLWLTPVTPLAGLLVLVDDAFTLDPARLLWKLLALAFSFGSASLAIHVVFARVVPPLLRGVTSRARRYAIQLAAIVATSAAVSVVIRHPHNLLCGIDFSVGRFVVVGLVISLVMTVPALLLQEQRTRVQQMEQLALAERRAALQAQLDALQARTNPHFLFNSINTVASLIPEDPVLAERTLERLADLFRYALDSGRTRSVPLQREFEMVTDYLAIQTVRFRDRLSVSVHLDPDVATFEVPPLLLQPIVENAILHGLADREHGTVDVRGYRSGAQVVVEVRDDGPGPGRSRHKGTRTSVRELDERLRLAFGDAARFVLEPLPDGGSLARLALPTRP